MPIILRKHLRFIAIVAIGIFGLALSAQARENNLAISGTTILPGQTATIAVNLHNTDNCYGLQFDITMPEGLSLTGVSKTNRTSNCVLTPNLNSGKERVVLLSLSNPLSGSYGDVCELKVQASPTFKGGILKITNAKMSDGGTSDITIPSTQCEFLNVKNATVILPDFSITAGESKYVGVNIKAEGNVAGLQVDLYLPNELTIDLSSIALSSSGSNFILDKQQHNGYIRVLIYSLSNAVISGNLDDVFSFAVKADESASGITEIKLQNISISSQTGVNIPLESSRTKVTINKPRASSITLSPASAILKVGEQQQIAATIFPENAANKELFWSIDNPAIATVDETGLVHAIGLGTAIITATSKDDTEIKATCQITVVATPAGSIILNKTEATLKATETLDLVATILPETITDKSVTWISSNEAIATVDANGKVTAMAVGKTTITVTAASGVSAKCAITVVETPAGGIIIDKDALGITGDNLEMRVGDVKAIKVTVTPETTTDKSVTYESSNPTVASVDENGNVTALSLGTSAITITAKSNPEVKATINVTVVATPAGSITLNKTETTLKATETVDLVATILPETTTDKSITWKSSDEAIATVDANGKVTAVAVGKATITATAASGISVECAITVVETPAGGITIDKDALGITGDNLEMHVGDVKAIKVTVTPETTTDKAVIYSSENPAVASVDEIGNVTALNLGTTTITIVAKSNPDVKATINVTVVATPAGSIILNKTETTLKATETVDLVATILPETTTDKSVTWKSSDETIATVDANGKVTAVAVGKATITATAASSISAECAITVIETPPGGIVIDKDALGITGDNLEMRVGDVKAIKVTVTPEATTDKAVTYSSENPAVASVDENGNVTALNLGTTTITIVAKSNPDVKSTINVTVVATPAGSIILNKTETTLKATETVDLVATILPETTTDKSVTWKSSDETIATVDANGKVTAVAVGKATITATAASSISAECAITVIETPPGGIVIDKDALGITGDNLEMRVGDVKAIKVTVTPEATTDKAVTYSSENPAVASVDENGNVTALNLGTTTITIVAKSNPDVKSTINVTVVATPAGSIILNKTETTLKATETVDLVATILPETTTDKSVTWKSSDETIATVDANGKVTAVAVGKATITATATTGIEATCAITVVATPAESIALNCEDATIRVNDTVVLNASIAPEQTTDKIVVWKSSDENIASVDANGVVRGLYSGVATITATAASGVSASCTVTVFPRETAPITVTRSNEKIIIMDGESAEMSVNITGGYPEGLIFAWSNGGNTVGSANSLTVVGRSNGNKKSNEFYRVHVVDVCDGVTLLDETYQFEVETWPLPATDVAIETDSDTDNLKIREGNLLELSAENPPGGYADNWGFDWYLDGTIISSEPEMSRLMTMYEDTEMATEKAVVTLIASNIGPDGTVWGEATSAPLNVTIYRRPLTPKQLLRKGDGTTHTVVAMSQYADTDLARLGYTFVYGYTDADGEDHVVATTVKRYCRLDKAIFDNVDCEKWCYSQWTYDDGSVVSSGKRYLDGRADENFDRSDFSGSANPKKSIDFSDSNNWIRSNGKNINISIETTDEARVDVYSIAGTLIDSVEIPADTFMSVDYTSDRLAPNFYIISVTTADKRVVKKVFIK